MSSVFDEPLLQEFMSHFYDYGNYAATKSADITSEYFHEAGRFVRLVLEGKLHV